MLDCAALDTRYKPQVAQSSSVKKKNSSKRSNLSPTRILKVVHKANTIDFDP